MFQVDADGLITYNGRPFARLVLETWQGGHVQEAIEYLEERDMMHALDVSNAITKFKEAHDDEVTRILESLWLTTVQVVQARTRIAAFTAAEMEKLYNDC